MWTGLLLLYGIVAWKFLEQRKKDKRERRKKREKVKPVQKVRPTQKREHTRSEKIGRDGEEQIATVLNEVPTMQAIFKNIYLPHPKDLGAYTEIDVLYLDKRGIVVVESKNYNGEIHPNLEEREWSNFNHGQKYNLFNPLWQNNLHKDALLRILPKEFRDSIYPIVVFGNQARIMNISLEKRTNLGILHTRELELNLEQHFKGKPIVIDEQKKAEILELLQPYLEISEELKEDHIQYVQNKSAGNYGQNRFSERRGQNTFSRRYGQNTFSGRNGRGRYPRNYGRGRYPRR